MDGKFIFSWCPVLVVENAVRKYCLEANFVVDPLVGILNVPSFAVFSGEKRDDHLCAESKS